MILPVLLNTSHRILLSHLCLSVLFSTLSTPFLMASKDAMSTENDEKSLKTQEIKASLAPLSTNLPIKNEIEERVWIPEIAAHFFGPLSFKDIRAGRCVSTSWQQILTGDDFCNYWGGHFSPSTPQAMGMTPQDFIRYWSTPSVHFLHEGEYMDMSANGSIIVGSMVDSVNDSRPVIHGVNGQITYLPVLNDWKNISVSKVSGDGSTIIGQASHDPVLWINGKTTYLPKLNNGNAATAHAINGDGSIIAGLATDGLNNNEFTPVQWVGGKITPLPYLNNGNYVECNGISSDGSIIVGETSIHGIRTAVQWISGEIKPLPCLDNWKGAIPTGISSDGAIIVGLATTTNNKHTAVQWVGGMPRPLPNLHGGFFAEATDVNDDGSIIVGAAVDGSNNRQWNAVLWVNGHIISLKKILEEAGVNVEGIHFNSARAISANGLQVIGSIQYGSEFKAVLPSKYTQ